MTEHVPVMKEGDPLLSLCRLAPGVVGYAIDCGPRGLYVPIINATDEGKGDVGRFLDRLKKLPLVKVPNVLSPRLRGMLLRRGFVVEAEKAPEFGCNVEVLVWRRDGSLTAAGQRG